MKILLFGRNGQVGWELQRSLAPLGELVALDRHSRDPAGDLSEPQAVASAIRALRPDVVVNAAAYTAVDKAESEPDLAGRINGEAPAAMALASADVGAAIVHYSTDYVFAGTGDQPWSEGDPTGPQSVYGRTKLAGERAVVAGNPRHLVFRTSWVHGARGGNFLKTMLRFAQERERLQVVSDQWGAPTGAELIADVTALAVAALARAPDLAGIYHLCAAGTTNWHAYASHVIATARASAQGGRVIVRDIEAVPASAYKSPAPRPHNSRLDTTKLERAFGLRMPRWDRGVDRVLSELGWEPAERS